MKKSLLLSIVLILLMNLAYSQKQPEFFGRYISVNDSLIELPPFDLTLSPLQMGDRVVPAFSTLPKNIQEINSITPTIIYYDQSVSTNTVRFTYIYMIGNSDKTFSYAPIGTVPLKIKPLDKQGMFLFKPSKPLITGLYAIYGGEVLGYQGSTSGNISLIWIKHPDQEKILKVAEDFISALDNKDYPAVSNLAYVWENNKDYKVLSEQSAQKIKRSKLFTGKVIPAAIQELKSADGTVFYKVFVISYGAFFTLKLGNLINTEITYDNFMLVCDKADGKLRVMTKPETGGWIFADPK